MNNRHRRIKTSKLEVDPPGELKRRKVPVLESINEFGDKNNLETGLKWD